jgi:hypothetical protein
MHMRADAQVHNIMHQRPADAEDPTSRMHVRECNAAEALHMLCMLRPASAATTLRRPRREPLHAGSPL